MNTVSDNVDIAIIGAGPTSLCFAKSLADTGLNTVILERQSKEAIAAPAFDGREIALTQHSASLLKTIGVWPHIDQQAIADLKDAKIRNGASRFSLDISHRDTQHAQLGYLVSNHLIRQAAYDAVKHTTSITLRANADIERIVPSDSGVDIQLAGGDQLHTKLLVAADGRFSSTRRAMGISADMHDFGKSMMVCVMTHEKPHEHVAWEWFDYGQTLALLPMSDGRASVVITQPPEEINRLMALDNTMFNSAVSAMFKSRLGHMQLVSTKHVYPLVTTYAKRFVGNRFALLGDAAVGMHPVTAHGFNFGLKGVATLSTEIQNKIQLGQDFASPAVLSRYEQRHRRQTKPLFLATHTIAKLYSANSIPSRLLRNGALRIGSRIRPFKQAVAGFLADAR